MEREVVITKFEDHHKLFFIVLREFIQRLPRKVQGGYKFF